MNRTCVCGIALLIAASTIVAAPRKSTIRPLFDSLFVEEKIEGTLTGTPFTTLSWTGFNTSTH